MSQPARVLFDENFGKPHVDRLVSYLEIQNEDERPVIRHIFDVAPPGTLDEEWLPLIVSEGWLVVSADRGKRGKVQTKGAPLPRVCVQFGISHVLLSASVHSLKLFDKMMAVLSVWSQITEAANGPRGQRYMLESTGDGRYRLSKRTTPQPSCPPKPSHGELFP